MPSGETQPTTFAEMVLALLEKRFPWLGKDEPVSGAETVDQLNDLHESLQKARTAAPCRKKR